MNFDRLVLIKKIEDKIQRLESKAINDHNDAVEMWALSKVKWQDKYGQAWNDYATQIIAYLNDGVPIRETDHPMPQRKGSGRYTAFFLGSLDKPEPREAKTADLKALLETLRATEDKTVSHSTIERLGFKVGDLFREEPREN